MRTTALLLASVLAASVHASVVTDEASVRAFAGQQAAAAAAREGFTRFEVQLGQVDSASTLAPCRRVEAFVPPGARAWGRTSVGLRCADGAAWTVLMPVTVQVWGRALVAAAPLAAGAVLSAQDLIEQEVELTREPPGAVRDAALLVGRALSRPVAAGAAVRADMTRAPVVVQAGDPVRVRIVGASFSIAAAGQALGAAAAGQSVRVRTDMGKILTGVAREGRIIDVAL